MSDSLIEKHGFKEEIAEEWNAPNFGAYIKTGFPQPTRRYRLIFESERASLEETYYWVLNACRQDFGFADVVKTLDTFSASENSSFWGMTEQRKGLQQDKASQYMATIGKMVKDLFQIVREVRVIKERIRLYNGAAKGKHADDVALKSYWTDMADGGSKGQMNIYQMAQQVGFGTLPDLFFSIYLRDNDDVAAVVDKKAGEFNEKVKSVLKQKLAHYLAWRVETEKEIRSREKFMIKYLRQHWASIRMYISWVKPYLRNVQKLSSPDKHGDNPDLISSFEGAVMEIEFLARKAAGKGKPASTVLATFQYRVRPQLQFQAEYQRGAIHVGRVEFSIRSYGWTDDDVEAYIKYREQETMNLIGLVDSSLKDALDALGDELLEYLAEAGEDVAPYRKEEKQEVKEQKKAPNFYEPFSALLGGFKDLFMMPFGPLVEVAKGPFEKKQQATRWRGHKGAAGAAAGISFNVYKNYKKSHGMPAW